MESDKIEFDQIALQNKTTAGQLEYLKGIKLNVLGNDKLKSTLRQNGSLAYFLMSLRDDHFDKAVLLEMSIIVSSFTFNKKFIPYLVKEDAIEALKRSSVNHFTLSEYNFKSLINILSFSPEAQMDLLSKSGQDFIRLLICIISSKATRVSALVFNACILIPYLPRQEVMPVARHLMNKLAVLLKPVFHYLVKDNSFHPTFKSYENCLKDQALPASPPSKIISNEVAPLLYSLSHVMPTLKRFSLPKPLYFCLTSLLTNESLNFRLAAANVLTLYSKYHLQGDLKEANYRKLVSTLMTLIEQMKNFKYRTFIASSNYKIKHEMNPLYLLSLLCKEDDILIDYLADCCTIDYVCDIIIKSYNLNTKFKTEDTLSKASDCFLVLSGICSSREHYREEIVNFDLKPILSDILNTHLQILKDLQQAWIDQKVPANADLVFEISNNIALASCYFIRSLSRSVSLLRTYLLDLKVTGVLIEILKFAEIGTENESLKGAEMILKSIILGILSNYILDFSSLRDDVMKNDIGALVADIILNSEHDLLRVYSLTLVSNCLCGIKDDEQKDQLIDLISLDKIFEFSYNENLKIQEKCFSIIRNLCSGSAVQSRKILRRYSKSDIAQANGDRNFLAFVTRKLEIADPYADVELISNICFTLVHIAASSEFNRSLMMGSTDLLHIIYSLLNSRSKGISETKIVSPCIWILINLTWKDDTSNSDDEQDQEQGEEDKSDADDINDEDEEMVEMDASTSSASASVTRATASSRGKMMHAADRAIQLHAMGFYTILKRLSTESVILDNRERAKTALYQLCSY